MIGGKVASILFGACARRNSIDDFNIMVEMFLPDRVQQRVFQWGPLLKNVHDYDNEIRNNLVGAMHAAHIIQIDSYVRGYLRANRDPWTRHLSFKDLQHIYPYMKPDSLEQEFHLTAAAPISEKRFPH